MKSIIVTLSGNWLVRNHLTTQQALESRAWYIGALGSRRTTEKRLQRLGQLGLGRQQLERLHAPVGLPIGSKTPGEIAVAIMAELTQLRRTRA